MSNVSTDSLGNTITNTHLPNKWLWPARGLWGVIALLVITMFVLGFPLRVADLRVPCIPEECLDLHLSMDGAQALEETLGITPLMFAVMGTGMEGYVTLVFLLSGVIIAWRRSDDWMALFSSGALIIAGVGNLAFLDTLVVHMPIFSVPARLAQALAFPLIILLFYLFPTGRFSPRWLRWPALIFTAAQFMIGLTYSPFTTPGVIALTITLAGGVYSQVNRYRNESSPAQRQQTKWVIVGFITMALSFALLTLILLIVPLSFDPSGGFAIHTVTDFLVAFPFGFIFVFVPMSFIPITFAISTLRRGLWNVDPIINRSLVYGGLTILLGLVFAGGFFGMQTLLEAILGGEQGVIAAVISTSAVFILFNPARRALRRFVDRRFYGIQIDYATPAPRDMRAGSVASLGGYSDLQPIGSGGMGEVYRAIHPQSGLPAAVKILPGHLAQELEFRKRFEREGQVVTALKHPNIVQIFDFGQDDGVYYMGMEFVGGVDLSRMLRDQGKLSLERVQDILQEVASALDYAHAQGIVHRDIKPSNIMMEPVRGSEGEYRSVLMDFGIAKIASGGTRLTFSGMVGTLDYIAPEQIQGAADVDHHADIYSLGVMTYQLLTGELPFKKANAGALVMAHLMEPPPDIRKAMPDVSDSTAHAIMRAMAKKPDARYDSAGDFLREMR